tara:strand:- start:1074 stop:1559 length:486 start_codon:yes stop_codon:yes gene_type:complete
MNSLFKFLWLLWKIFCVIIFALLVFSWPLKLVFDEYGISHPFFKNYESDIPGTYKTPGKKDTILELFDGGVASTHFGGDYMTQEGMGMTLSIGEWEKNGKFLFVRSKYLIGEDINGKTFSMDNNISNTYIIQKNGDLAGSTRASRGEVIFEGVIRWKRIRR